MWRGTVTAIPTSAGTIVASTTATSTGCTVIEEFDIPVLHILPVFGHGFFFFFQFASLLKLVVLKQQEILNTRKDGTKDIYSVSTAAASSAGLVCSSWVQVTLGMVATTTSVHSTSPFSRQDFSVIVVGSTFWTG